MVRYLIPLLLVGSALLLGKETWSLYMLEPWTRDAKIRAEITKVAPKVSGQIVKIHVRDNDFVAQGDVLFEIESTDYSNHLKQLTSALALAEARLAQAKNNYDRDEMLVSKHMIAEKKVTNERLEVAAQLSAVDKAKADVEQAQLNLSRVKVVAPKNGYITNLKHRVGNYINTGETFSALVEENSFYVLGYFTEAKVRYIKQGQTVTIFPYTSSEIITGTVDSISRAIVDQSADQSGLIPSVQATIPWVRLGQRVPVRITITEDSAAQIELIAGTTVTVKVTR